VFYFFAFACMRIFVHESGDWMGWKWDWLEAEEMYDVMQNVLDVAVN
jgi:hypothetical protein